MLAANMNGGNLNAMYSCTFGSDGIISNWVTAGSLPVASIQDTNVVVTRNRVYLIGGDGSQDISNSIFVASINQDGTLGSWSNSGLTLPKSIYGYWNTTIVTRSKVIIIQPYGSYGYSRTHFEAPINADGTLGTWTTTSITNTPGLRNFSLFVTSTRVYIVGGELQTGGYANTIYSNQITGGTNDYSPYYNGTSTVTDPNSFVLPDYTSLEEPGYYFFIKT